MTTSKTVDKDVHISKQGLLFTNAPGKSFPITENDPGNVSTPNTSSHVTTSSVNQSKRQCLENRPTMRGSTARQATSYVARSKNNAQGWPQNNKYFTSPLPRSTRRNSTQDFRNDRYCPDNGEHLSNQIVGEYHAFTYRSSMLLSRSPSHDISLYSPYNSQDHGETYHPEGHNTRKYSQTGVSLPSPRTSTPLGKRKADWSPNEDKSKQFRVGDVVHVAWTQAVSSDRPIGAHEDHAAFVDSKQVGRICAKMRPAVVVGVHSCNLTVVPIFSSGGKGLTHKSVEYRRDCLEFRRRAGEGLSWFKDMTSIFLYAREDRFVPKENSYVMLTQSFSVQYDSSPAWKGTLIEDSIRLLREKFVMLTIKSLEEPEQQGKFQNGESITEYQKGKFALDYLVPSEHPDMKRFDTSGIFSHDRAKAIKLSDASERVFKPSESYLPMGPPQRCLKA